ncbi:MAG: hypothetical protein LH649_14165, partial [Pseudanabaena sp. CAN_BIN31]|nr:hypothetical protein [Pseudanabaena sp. CAN_BIN31]
FTSEDTGHRLLDSLHQFHVPHDLGTDGCYLPRLRCLSPLGLDMPDSLRRGFTYPKLIIA